MFQNNQAYEARIEFPGKWLENRDIACFSDSEWILFYP